jgi:hypothetical protein
VPPLSCVVVERSSSSYISKSYWYTGSRIY